MNYAASATQYAQDVVDGRILACLWVQLACKRHLDWCDAKRYYWDKSAVDHIC